MSNPWRKFRKALRLRAQIRLKTYEPSTIGYLSRPLRRFFRDPAATDMFDDHPNARKFRSVFIRHVDCGSDNGVELELQALTNPVYDLERFGIQFVASPRHADILMISGPLSRNMLAPLKRTYDAINAPHLEPKYRNIITVGDDADFRNPAALGNQLFGMSYAVTELPEDMRRNILDHIPGDPPSPDVIIKHLLDIDFKINP